MGDPARWSDANHVGDGQTIVDLDSDDYEIDAAEAARRIVKATNAGGAGRTLKFPDPPSDAAAYQRTVRNQSGQSLTIDIASGGTTVVMADDTTQVVGFEPAGAFEIAAAL